MTRLLTTAVILLFLALSTNAFACLVPLYGASNMEAGCPSGAEQSPREFCDVFKFGVPAYSSHPQIHASQLAVSILEIDFLSLLHSIVVVDRNPGYAANNIPQNVLLKTTILRI